MEKLKKYLDYQTELALIIIGVALIIFGFYFFLEVKQLEEANQVVRMKKYLMIIYNFGGKYSILALFEISAIIALYYGIKQLRELNTKEADTTI